MSASFTIFRCNSAPLSDISKTRTAVNEAREISEITDPKGFPEKITFRELFFPSQIKPLPAQIRTLRSQWKAHHSKCC